MVCQTYCFIVRGRVHIRHKFESFEIFKKFRSEVEKQTEKLFKILRLDRGEEYLSEKFFDYLRENGTVFQ